MSQYSDFDTSKTLNYTPGSHKSTLPPAYLTAPPAAPTACYRGVEGGLPLFLPSHTSLSHSTTASNQEISHERLLVVQDMMKWVVQDQHKLLEKMEKIMSNQARGEENLKALGTSLVRLSKDFDNWKQRTGSDVGTSYGNGCGDEGDGYTDAIVGDRPLPY